MLPAGPERERVERAAEAEADVSVPIGAVGADTQDEMRSWAKDTRRRAQAHAREKHVDFRTERFERSLQQQVLLEAIPTTALQDELSFQVSQLQATPESHSMNPGSRTGSR